jgi:GTP-binding protein YchF
MKIGIIGLPQVGKKTLFQVLTGHEVNETAGPAKPIPGTADLVDQRFDRLVAMYEPKKQTRARLDLVLLPKMEQEAIVRGDIFRAFEDEAVYHAAGSVDPLRDVETVGDELLLHDQVFLEKRIERLETAVKKVKDERQQKELDLLKRLQAQLEGGAPLRLLTLSDEEDLLIRSYPLITRKEMVLVFNVGEDSLGDTSLLDRVADLCRDTGMEAMIVSAKVEAEIALLDSAEERQAFLQDLGIEEPALQVLARLCLKALGRISFFTVGKDEVHQWLVRVDSPAPAAAGVIHTDLQKGFIRAEVIKYDDLIAYGSEAELKKAGKLMVQGKDYIVVDGDILNIRFNL